MTAICETDVSIPTLPHLVSIWPVLERIVAHLSVGDLIVLARSSSELRAILHGFPSAGRSDLQEPDHQYQSPLRPQVGHHETTFWRYLKSRSSFRCSRKTHTRGDRTQPCVYCSVPICEACIVRDSFKHPNENTFRNRYRYLCYDCWTRSKPTKSFRYSPRNEHSDLRNAPRLVDTNEFEGDVSENDGVCSCTLKVNGWICHDCKDRQNSSPLAVGNFSKQQSGTIECFGLACNKTIQISSPKKEHCRICLWCEKGLNRQLGGAYYMWRHAWFAELCAANAVERNARSSEQAIKQLLSPDIFDELDFRESRTSRNELRGTNEDGGDELELIRDLDSINYRNFLVDSECPSPESVWQSRNGSWQYNKEFLLALGRYCAQSTSGAGGLNNLQTSDLTMMTRNGSSPYARTNAGMGWRWHFQLLEPPFDMEVNSSRILEVFKTRILDFFFDNRLRADKLGLELVQDLLKEQYGLDVRLQQLHIHLKFWTKPSQLMGISTSNEIHTGDKAEPPMQVTSEEYEEHVIRLRAEICGKGKQHSEEDNEGSDAEMTEDDDDVFYDAKTLAEVDGSDDNDEDMDEGQGHKVPGPPTLTSQGHHSEAGEEDKDDSDSVASSTTQIVT